MAAERVSSWRELEERVNRLGFLPLFRNEIEGFSAEEYTAGMPWWSGDPEQDPWFWREVMARGGRVAYGKFFGRKAGFISLEWLPYFVNFRREGYDFDARWEDGLAPVRQKKLMDCFAGRDGWIGAELQAAAGFGKGGEKNFAGVMAELQMQTYLVIRDFRQKVNKRGAPYGMPVSVYARPEAVWGYGAVTAAYAEEPAASKERIYARAGALFPRAAERQLQRVLG